MASKAESAGFRDPHVFPFLVKGYDPSGKIGGLVYESRRNRVEADQTVERLNALGYVCYTFELKLVDVTAIAET